MKNKWTVFFIFFLGFNNLNIKTWASNPQEATLTSVTGPVQIFKNPSRTLAGPSPRVLFEGEFYTATDARSGDQVGKGNIVRVLPGGGAKVIYDNGDQIQVAPGTAYRIKWDDSKDGSPKMELMYGKIRGIVEKGGPRGKFYIKTRSAAMGVRGTDFFINDVDPKKGTQVTILRGAVELTQNTPKAKPLLVKTGFSATVPPPPPLPPSPPQTQKQGKQVVHALPSPLPPPPAIEISASTQEDLVEVQKTTAILKKEIKDEEKTLPPAVQKKLQELETKAVQTTLSDIKKEDPILYAQLKDKPLKNVDEINTANVKKLILVAPPAPPKKLKPSMNDLDEHFTPDVYKKYFKEFE